MSLEACIAHVSVQHEVPRDVYVTALVLEYLQLNVS